MRLLVGVASLLACIALIGGHTCHGNGETYYHADVSTGCQVYHLCRGFVISTLSCPSGQAFDHRTNECKDQALVECIETEHHHRHKRSEPSTEVMVHSIDISELKASAKRTCLHVKSLIRTAIQEVAPTVHAQIQANYEPMVQRFKTEVMPFITEKVMPEVHKAHRYFDRFMIKVIAKAYKSFELSNSTHINLVTFSDLATELARDLEPVLKLGKYLHANLSGP